MLQHPEDAQEAAQETLLRVYKQLHHLKDDEQLAGWIMRIARNVCLDHIRARSCRPTWTSWGQADEDGGSLPAELAEPEVILLRRHETAYVHHVISSLPQLHQVAILLRDFDELSHAEIADVLDMTPSQVKALVHRARRNFRRSWKSGAVSASL
jgi:RNA polymerase sigma-70 factor (ECF subfamily)